MSNKIVVAASPSQRMAAVDTEGKLTLQHRAAGPYLRFPDGSQGELLLCGAAISYATFNGIAVDAPECAECERRDG